MTREEMAAAPHTFDKLVSIMSLLRKECPWDREQTHDSIKGHTIEEAYEVVEAIDHRNDEELKNELGDLLLHVLFHSEIAHGEERFTLQEVIEAISSKLVRRHPHVFGDLRVSGAAEVRQNWEEIKMGEGRDSILDGLPRNLPALLKAYRMQDKASKVGFDWPHRKDVWKKVEEEIAELQQAVDNSSHGHVEEELGDLLFAIVNFARFVRVNPEDALRRTIDKFSQRFRYIERRLRECGKDIHHSTLEEMDLFWEEAKRSEV